MQLIQNGFGPYIFDNPFAKAMRQFGAKEFAKLIYSAKKIYDENLNIFNIIFHRTIVT